LFSFPNHPERLLNHGHEKRFASVPQGCGARKISPSKITVRKTAVKKKKKKTLAA
jgi:hypothetical protein